MRLDTTDSKAVSNSNPDIAVFAPAGFPRVLDYVVLLIAFFAIANCKHTVVKLSSTPGVGNDSSSVVLEHPLVSLDSH